MSMVFVLTVTVFYKNSHLAKKIFNKRHERLYDYFLLVHVFITHMNKLPHAPSTFPLRISVLDDKG